MIRSVVTRRSWSLPLKVSRPICREENVQLLGWGSDRLGRGAEGNLEKLCNLYWIYSCCVYRCVVLLRWGSQSSNSAWMSRSRQSHTQAPQLTQLHSSRFCFSFHVPPLQFSLHGGLQGTPTTPEAVFSSEKFLHACCWVMWPLMQTWAANTLRNKGILTCCL